jgi:hypothetical protein
MSSTENELEGQSQVPAEMSAIEVVSIPGSDPHPPSLLSLPSRSNPIWINEGIQLGIRAGMWPL